MTRFFLLAISATLAIASAATRSDAQQRWSQFAVGTDWNTDDNWDGGFVPDPSFDEGAIIGSTVLGAASSAAVDFTGDLDSPTVTLGDGGGADGTLNIAAGNTLTTVEDLTAGDFFVGVNGGQGVLNLGGTLDVVGEIASTSGSGDSAINLTGSASLVAETAFFDRQLRIEGSNVSVAITGTSPSGNGVIFGLAGTHTWVIGASGASTVSVASNADLGGALSVEFDGVTPAPGDTWDLIDAGMIDANDAIPSGFSQIVTTADDSLGLGQTFAVNRVAGGANGVLGQLTLEQQPVLIVNRGTGEITIENPGAVDSIEIDTYVVNSQAGGLNPGAFSGGLTEPDWFDANPTTFNISELNPNGSSAFGASSEVSLGAVFAPPTPSEFGEENEDIVFQFARPGGDLVQGEVFYEGLPNNTLTLVVDPNTGGVQVVNPSGFNVGIDAYVISSESGSLDSVGWNSLQDQGADGGDWFEANPDSSALSELLAEGASPLIGNGSTILELGTAFDTAGAQDLVLQFALEGESELRTGKVVYQSLLSSVDLPGDYNGDAVVDAADYTVWRDAFETSGSLPVNDTTPGSVSQADYDVWAANFGATLGSATAVPEPASAALLMTLLAGAFRRR